LPQRGEIDVVAIPRLRAALDCIDATYNAVLDMAGVTFMDSGGLTALAIHTMRLRAGGGSLKIRHASSAVRRVVESAGMGELLDEPISRSSSSA
jgi:anti-anti-sigma factor